MLCLFPLICLALPIAMADNIAVSRFGDVLVELIQYQKPNRCSDEMGRGDVCLCNDCHAPDKKVKLSAKNTLITSTLLCNIYLMTLVGN